MESSVENWVCLIVPQVPVRVMLGHVCARLKNVAASSNSHVILEKLGM